MASPRPAPSPPPSSSLEPPPASCSVVVASPPAATYPAANGGAPPPSTTATTAAGATSPGSRSCTSPPPLPPLPLPLEDSTGATGPGRDECAACSTAVSDTGSEVRVSVRLAAAGSGSACSGRSGGFGSGGGGGARDGAARRDRRWNGGSSGSSRSTRRPRTKSVPSEAGSPTRSRGGSGGAWRTTGATAKASRGRSSMRGRDPTRRHRTSMSSASTHSSSRNSRDDSVGRAGVGSAGSGSTDVGRRCHAGSDFSRSRSRSRSSSGSRSSAASATSSHSCGGRSRSDSGSSIGSERGGRSKECESAGVKGIGRSAWHKYGAAAAEWLCECVGAAVVGVAACWRSGAWPCARSASCRACDAVTCGCCTDACCLCARCCTSTPAAGRRGGRWCGPSWSRFIFGWAAVAAAVYLLTASWHGIVCSLRDCGSTVPGTSPAAGTYVALSHTAALSRARDAAYWGQPAFTAPYWQRTTFSLRDALGPDRLVSQHFFPCDHRRPRLYNTGGPQRRCSILMVDGSRIETHDRYRRLLGIIDTPEKAVALLTMAVRGLRGGGALDGVLEGRWALAGPIGNEHILIQVVEANLYGCAAAWPRARGVIYRLDQSGAIERVGEEHVVVTPGPVICT